MRHYRTPPYSLRHDKGIKGIHVDFACSMDCISLYGLLTRVTRQAITSTGQNGFTDVTIAYTTSYVLPCIKSIQMRDGRLTIYLVAKTQTHEYKQLHGRIVQEMTDLAARKRHSEAKLREQVPPPTAKGRGITIPPTPDSLCAA